ILDWMEAQGEAMSVCLVGEPTCPDTLGDMMKIGRRGSMTGYFTAEGVQGHSAYPHRAKNPLHALVALLDRLTEWPLDGGTAHFDASTLQITTIDCGNPANNVIPARASATVNIRFNDAHTGNSLSDWLATHAEAVETETGRRPDLSTSGGTSDARFVKNHCPVVEFGLVGRTMHQVDERVELAQIAALKAVYGRILARYFA
ncbi:M20/M25/M40 family metallo-hydrolase, partial [Candidatus Falkowbacteria bacterium]|nr:M20/M25/M40 family metallo-hydrolase [Candidatus Falkowbacteria bacterium]